MAYTPTYQETDISPATIDTVVKVIAVFGSLGTLIGLVIVYVIAKKSFK